MLFDLPGLSVLLVRFQDSRGKVYEQIGMT